MKENIKTKIKATASGKPTEFLTDVLNTLDSARERLRACKATEECASQIKDIDDSMSEAIFQIANHLTTTEDGRGTLTEDEINDLR